MRILTLISLLMLVTIVLPDTPTTTAPKAPVVTRKIKIRKADPALIITLLSGKSGTEPETSSKPGSKP